MTHVHAWTQHLRCSAATNTHCPHNDTASRSHTPALGNMAVHIHKHMTPRDPDGNNNPMLVHSHTHPCSIPDQLLMLTVLQNIHKPHCRIEHHAMQNDFGLSLHLPGGAPARTGHARDSSETSHSPEHASPCHILVFEGNAGTPESVIKI